MKKIKVGVIGTGVMGKSHVRVYSEMDNVDLLCICDKDRASADYTAKKHGIRAFYDYQKIDACLDAVSICVPTVSHKETAMHFIQKGIPVLVEKPIAASVAEAKELISEAEKHDVNIMVGHVERFNPVVQEVKKRIEKKELGRIYDIKALRFSPFPQRVIDVGVTIDLAVHDIDVMLYITGSKIKRLYSETAQRIHAKNEDLLNALVKFENGINGTIHTNWLTPRKVRELFITGEKGMFVAKYLTQELFFYKNSFADKEMDYSKGVTSVIEGDMVQVKINYCEPLRIELEEFIDSVASKRKPLVTAEQGLMNLFIAQKLIESARKNEVIEL